LVYVVCPVPPFTTATIPVTFVADPAVVANEALTTFCIDDVAVATGSAFEFP
jgi:hypothetical protein